MRLNEFGVWEMGGVGKTTLVKNLNNELQASSLMDNLFELIIWFTISKDLDLEKIQSQIANILKVELDAD